MAETTSVGLDMPVQQERVRGLVTMYRDPMLSGAGEIAARLMESALKRAEQAMASGDIVEIIQSYRELKEFQA